MAGALYTADVLGSQANEAVLVEQPQAYITQKARVKRNRRTEWDYYVQFPGFPEDEGAWYSARAIKTQHPRGVELIREFEHPVDSPDVTPPPPARQPQSAPQVLPFTQDAGPSQIGSHPLHGESCHVQRQQPYTQDQYASQLQELAEYKPVAAAAPHKGFQVNQMHGLNSLPAQDVFQSASQNSIQPALHWSFDRLRQAPQHNLQQMFRSSEALQPIVPQDYRGAGYSVHSVPKQATHVSAQAASISMPQDAPHARPRGQVADCSQIPAAPVQQPGWASGQKPIWSSGMQSEWQQATNSASGGLHRCHIIHDLRLFQTILANSS